MTKLPCRAHRSGLTLLLGVLILALASGTPCRAQNEKEPPEQPGLPNVAWQKGPGKATLGSLAEIQIPDGFMFAGSADTITLLEAMQNPTSGRELGFLSPVDMAWFVVFEFSDTGYVKDDEKDKLDADAILKSLREGNESGNEVRKQRGWAPLSITGWDVTPRYDQQTHNLEWGIRVKGTGESVNYNVRILGRGGVMEATLLIEPEQLNAVLPEFRKLLGGYSYTAGNQYAEYKSGDKLAQYGLAALVTGGGVALAASTGLLAKMWKLIVVAIAAVIGAIKKGFNALFGRNKQSADGKSPNA